MFLEKSPISVILIICLLTAYALFNIKENVVNIKGELVEVNKQVQHEVDTIHLLKAELAYLASPERLKSLNETYIRLSDTKIEQMRLDPIIQEDKIKTQTIVSTNIAKNTKWRYKKGPSKYLTMVSKKK